MSSSRLRLGEHSVGRSVQRNASLRGARRRTQRQTIDAQRVGVRTGAGLRGVFDALEAPQSDSGWHVDGRRRFVDGRVGEVVTGDAARSTSSTGAVCERAIDGAVGGASSTDAVGKVVTGDAVGSASSTGAVCERASDGSVGGFSSATRRQHATSGPPPASSRRRRPLPPETPPRPRTTRRRPSASRTTRRWPRASTPRRRRCRRRRRATAPSAARPGTSA